MLNSLEAAPPADLMMTLKLGVVLAGRAGGQLINKSLAPAFIKNLQICETSENDAQRVLTKHKLKGERMQMQRLDAFSKSLFLSMSETESQNPYL